MSEASSKISKNPPEALNEPDALRFISLRCHGPEILRCASRATSLGRWAEGGLLILFSSRGALDARITFVAWDCGVRGPSEFNPDVLMTGRYAINDEE